MTTFRLTILNLNTPCNCACRYCFLCAARGQASGVDYARGEALASRFAAWRAEQGLDDFSLDYTIGHCADYPELSRNIAFNRALGFVGAGYVQANGIALRAEGPLREYLAGLRAAGAKQIDASFYGLGQTHDSFAGRAGDFAFMLLLLRCAMDEGLGVVATFVITEENKDELGRLVDLLEGMGVRDIYGFLPDCRGRGALLEPIRLTQASAEALPERVRRRVNWGKLQTEAAWLKQGFAPETRRVLRLALEPGNIERLEGMGCGEIVAWLEALDDAYYAALPPWEELGRCFGDPESQALCHQRDLQWRWAAHWNAQHTPGPIDVTEERHCGSVRY